MKERIRKLNDEAGEKAMQIVNMRGEVAYLVNILGQKGREWELKE